MCECFIEQDGDKDSLASVPSQSQTDPADYLDVNDDDVIVLIVGGTRHEVLRSFLLNRPDTRLAALALNHKPGKSGPYFFDRNAMSFYGIINYYRLGIFIFICSS